MTDPRAAPSSLATDLAGLALRNPLLLAAGTAGTLDEMSDVLDLESVGGVVTKSITAQPREGNATWRILPTEHAGGQGGAMLNAIGLANIGVDEFAAHVAPRVAEVPCAVIGSVAGFSIDDYVRVAGVMDDVDALGAIELNVSCPNVHGGTEFGADPRALRELLAAVRPVVERKPLIVKLSPIAVGAPGNTMTDLARAAIDPPSSRPSGPRSRPGADALTIANTVPAMAVDVRTRRPRLSNVTGGLSGPAVHPIAVKLVWDVYRNVARDTGTPIIGLGGVTTWQDAAEFILVGASCVAMGTVLFADPRAPRRITRGLERWVHDQGVASVRDLIGAVRV